MAGKFSAGEIGGGLTIEDLEAEKCKTEQVNVVANPPRRTLKDPKEAEVIAKQTTMSQKLLGEGSSQF